MTPSTAFDSGRLGRTAHDAARLSSWRHAPSAAANVLVVTALENARGRPAKGPSELAADTEVAVDRLNA